MNCSPSIIDHGFLCGSVAVSRVLQLWVECSRSKQRKNLNPVSVFAQFGGVGQDTQHKIDVLILCVNSSQTTEFSRSHGISRNQASPRFLTINGETFATSSGSNYRSVATLNQRAVGSTRPTKSTGARSAPNSPAQR